MFILKWSHVACRILGTALPLCHVYNIFSHVDAYTPFAGVLYEIEICNKKKKLDITVPVVDGQEERGLGGLKPELIPVSYTFINP